MRSSPQDILSRAEKCRGLDADCSARRAGLHALAAANAARLPHRVVEVEHDLGLGAAKGIADHVVHLLLATGPHAACALDAGRQVYGRCGLTHAALLIDHRENQIQTSLVLLLE